jgi:AMMECR1 domain-containing protein
MKFNGVPGFARGVTGDDFSDHAPVSAAFFAATWNAYAVPRSSPVTFTEVAVIEVEVVLLQSEYRINQIASDEEPGGGSACIRLATHD